MQTATAKPNKRIRLVWVTAAVLFIAAGAVSLWYFTRANDNGIACTYADPANMHDNTGYGNDVQSIDTSYYNNAVHYSDSRNDEPYSGLHGNNSCYDNEYYNDTYDYEEPVILSPSDLQLAMFAHMAFFPFDFNAGGLPQAHGFDKIHYAPFLELVMTDNPQVQNQYGFSFAREMEGWHLTQIYNDRATGFKVVVYTCAYGNSIVLAIRGSDGHLGESLLAQSGTWWCNLRSMAGYRHSHKDALVNFLNEPGMAGKLEGANIYITGHSLGGYLAYIAAYELVRMGLEVNIRRVTAFSAPIFTANTHELLAALSPDVRNRMIHFYVPEDLIAGFIGIDMGTEFPGYGALGQIARLMGTLRDVRNINIPPALYAFSSLLALTESLLPFEVPAHIAEIVWRLNGVAGEDAMILTNEFRSLIAHEQVPLTWQSERPPPPWDVNASLLEILTTHTQELMIEIVLDMILLIFDTDAHFMMNFYPHLTS